MYEYKITILWDQPFVWIKFKNLQWYNWTKLIAKFQNYLKIINVKFLDFLSMYFEQGLISNVELEFMQ